MAESATDIWARIPLNDPVRRRFGSAFPDHPCANPAVIECAAWECQSLNHCRLTLKTG